MIARSWCGWVRTYCALAAAAVVILVGCDDAAQLHTQVAADTAFYGRLVKRFDRDIERWTT